ncbi:MAG: transposase, partial [Rhodobacteraceae bacterium]
MTASQPKQIWWTPDELAAAGLPEMPGSRRGINLLADRLGWRETPGCAQRKPGRGGGWQYHWSVLPLAAQRKLLADAADAPDAHADRGTAWAEFDGLPNAAKAKAAERLKSLQVAETLHRAGATHVHAMSQAARMAGVSVRTLYNWLEMIEGIAPEDRLAYLVPRNRLVQKSGVDSTNARPFNARPFMEFLKALYLRLEQPTFRQCHRTACAQAKA